MIIRPQLLFPHVLSIGNYNNLVEIGRFESATVAYGTAGWPANNLAVYMPVHLPAPFTVSRFLVANGSNLTGTVDVGLYNFEGTRLLSTGNTARSGASAVQYIGVTDQRFPAGHYYLGMVTSSTTGTYGRLVISAGAAPFDSRMCGLLEESLGSAVLPATMTPAAYTRTTWYYYGFTQSDTL